ncbi:glycine--tRNA ligase [Proteinivorax hydrogeniformans]|uniref:Glycine--tRNA ligase n=1 Tax=Proteinivorax hydrogeniformans TaxID=1826727 RepID=A0AAU8HSW1_9FIRM
MSKKMDMDTLVGLCKSRGFIFPGSDIYGGLANTWDYGPLGIELLNNIKSAWWKKFVRQNLNVVGLDSALLMNPKVWEASGHIGGFNDPLIDCKDCKSRYRADKLVEEYHQDKEEEVTGIDGWSEKQLKDFIENNEIKCPQCGEINYTDIREFNLMFKTFQGVTEDSQSEVYLRPETAQGIFINFKNVARSCRKQVPFGIAQIGKSFRNEITPGNFIFRTREFEQMEMEFFCHPGEGGKWYDYWKEFCHKWLLDLGVSPDSIRMRDHDENELSHYSDATTDIEFKFPFGWGELWGVANRTDFDLKRHMEHSKKDLSYQDPITQEKFVPYVIEPSVGLNRLALAFLADCYQEEELEKNSRTVLKIHPVLAPFKAAVLPLSKKLSDEAMEVFDKLNDKFMLDFDEKGSIGKRYRRQDEIGTPFCITFDFDSLEDKCVTIRDRDSMEQSRISINEAEKFLEEKLKY